MAPGGSIPPGSRSAATAPAPISRWPCSSACATPAPNPLRAGLLIYGAYAAYTADFESASQQAFGDGSYILSAADMRWFWNHYVRDEADNRNPLAVPLLADLAGLPPLMVTAAELDPLLDDSTALVAKLEAAGTPHRYVLWPGVTHASIQMTRMLDVAKDHTEAMAAWLREQVEQ